MGRHFLAVDIIVDRRADAPLTLITTHLESTKSERSERVKQFTEVLLASADYSAIGPRTVALAGDLNIRDDEVLAARKSAREKRPRVDDVVDAWTWCGSPKTQEFTWDTSVNNNLGVQYSSRCRFDRCFFSSPGATDGRGALRGKPRSGTAGEDQGPHKASHWVASALELVGRSKVEGLGRFPSDHWGIQITWSLPVASGQPSQPSQASIVAGSIERCKTAVGANDAHAAADLDKAADRPVLLGSALSDEERARRRQQAAAQAEQRQKELSTRGARDLRNLPHIASPQLDVPAEGVSGEQETEEAMLARAIALSLQGDSGGVADKSCGNSAGSIASEVSAKFDCLAGSGAGVTSKPLTIDLDSD